MRLENGRIFLSPTDLARFQDCNHVTALDLNCAQGKDLCPAEDDAEAKLLYEKGEAYEEPYLATLAKEGVVSISYEPTFSVAAEETFQAMREGAPLIYTRRPGYRSMAGRADFIEKVRARSALGDFSYEVTDAKLKRRAEPKQCNSHSTPRRLEKFKASCQPRRMWSSGPVIGSLYLCLISDTMPTDWQGGWPKRDGNVVGE